MVGVDGFGRRGDVAGGRLYAVRVHTLLRGRRRGSPFVMAEPDVVIGGTICLQVQWRRLRKKSQKQSSDDRR